MAFDLLRTMQQWSDHVKSQPADVMCSFCGAPLAYTSSIGHDLDVRIEVDSCEQCSGKSRDMETARMMAALRLISGWKPLDEIKVTARCIRTLLDLVAEFPVGTPTPQVVPTNSGGLQLEWHVHDKVLEIECDPDGFSIRGLYLCTGSSTDGWENDLTLEENRRELGLVLERLAEVHNRP